MLRRSLEIVPQMAGRGEIETIAFDGTAIKQEAVNEAVAEVRVTLPAGSESLLHQQDVVSSGDTGVHVGSSGTLMIKQEEGGAWSAETAGEGGSGSHIVCTGDLEGDQWVVQQVTEEEEDAEMVDRGKVVGASVPQTSKLDIPPSKRRKHSLIKGLLGIAQLPTEEVSSSSSGSRLLDAGQMVNSESGLQLSSHTVADTMKTETNKAEETTCDYCGKALTTPGSYKSHWLYHKSMETLKDNDVECYECKNPIPKHYIKYHVKIHSGEKPYKCDICHKSFVHSRSFNLHAELHTRQKRQYTCSICGKEFAHEYLLRRHSVIHEKYKCPICGHLSTNKHKFDSHNHKHETNVYICDICNKSYSKEASLISHKCFVHMITGKMFVDRRLMYKCQECDEVFAEGQLLKEHLESCKAVKVNLKQEMI